MFNTLLESKASKQQTGGGSTVQLHHPCRDHRGLAIYATRQRRDQEREGEGREARLRRSEEGAGAAKAEAAGKSFAPPPPKGFQVLTAPINIPDVIPDVDLTKKVTDEADFTGKGVAGGSPRERGDKPVTTSRTSTSRSRSRPRRCPAVRPPHYPDMLTSAGIEGQVFVAVRGRYQWPRRHEHVQGAQVGPRAVHRGGEDRRSRTCASIRPKSAGARSRSWCSFRSPSHS